MIQIMIDNVPREILERVVHYWDDDRGTGIRPTLLSMLNQVLNDQGRPTDDRAHSRFISGYTAGLNDYKSKILTPPYINPESAKNPHGALCYNAGIDAMVSINGLMPRFGSGGNPFWPCKDAQELVDFFAWHRSKDALKPAAESDAGLTRKAPVKPVEPPVRQVVNERVINKGEINDYWDN